MQCALYNTMVWLTHSRDGERVTEVKEAVHVGEGEGDHVLGRGIGLLRGVLLEHALLLPLRLHLPLHLLQELHLERPLGRHPDERCGQDSFGIGQERNASAR